MDKQTVLRGGAGKLAERLRITLDVARMDAEPQGEDGEWRILPGDEINERGMIELPSEHRNVSRQGDGTIGPSRAERADQLAGDVLAGLLEAWARIDDLTSQLLAEKDAHRQTSSRLQEQLHELVTQLLDEQQKHRQDAMELVGAEMREMGTKAELDRAESEVADLQRAISHLQRHWWRRIFGNRWPIFRHHAM